MRLLLQIILLNGAEDSTTMRVKLISQAISLAFLLACLAGIPGCANPKSAEAIGEKQIIGDWEAVATQITFETEGGKGNSRSISVSEGEWESHQNRTAPQTSYLANHQFVSQYVSLVGQDGQQVHDTIVQKGTWSLVKDTLMIEEKSLSVPQTKFILKLKGDQLELSCTMDMDGDGAVDDKYWMMQRRKK